MRAVLLISALLLGACKANEQASAPARREPPPPAPKPSPSACGSGPGQVNDATNLTLLPATAGSFCIDRSGTDRGYGEGAQGPLEGICDLFDGECAIYQKLAVKRVVEARYVDGGGSSATIDVKLSWFASPEHALAMFTKRALGGGDPGHPDTPKPLSAGAMAALGIGNAYLWRGVSLAEITYNDADASVEQISKKANALLPPLAKELGDKLPGDLAPPAAVKLLPGEDRLPMGIGYELPDAPLPAPAPRAIGFYRNGDKRWRVGAYAPKDEAHAKAIVKPTSMRGASEEKGLGEQAWRFLVGAGDAEAVQARKGAKVMLVMDEPLVLRSGMSVEQRRLLCLPLEEKRERLRALLP